MDASPAKGGGVIRIPLLSSFDISDWAAISAAFEHAPLLKMGQAWRGVLEKNFRGAEVRVGWREGAVLVFARMTDDCCFTGATGDNQRLWELGDVFEMFVKDAERQEYFEFHITPRGHRLQLRFPNNAAVGQLRSREVKLADFMIDEIAFNFKVRDTANGWEAFAELPNELFGWDKTPGHALLASFSRYDYGDKGDDPVLSSTSDHVELNYHRQEEWKRLVISL